MHHTFRHDIIRSEHGPRRRNAERIAPILATIQIERGDLPGSTRHDPPRRRRHPARP